MECKSLYSKKDVILNIKTSTLSLNKIFLLLILIFPITTVFTGVFSWLNKLMFFILIIFQVAVIITKRLTIKSFVIIFVTILLHFLALCNSEFYLINKNDFFYFLFMVLFFRYICDNVDSFKKLLSKSNYLVKTIIILWSLVIAISAVIPSSYVVENNVLAFASFSGSTFRLAPTALFILSLVLYLIVSGESKLWVLGCVFPMFCFFMGGTRTYFGIGAILFLVVLYYSFDKKIVFKLLLIPITILGVYFFINSSVGEKFFTTQYTSSSYYDFWGTITNARSVFWAADLNEFFNSGVLGIIIGNGFNFVYDVNARAVGATIWAHNDFIQILCSFGLIGLFVYLFCVYDLFKKLFSRNRIKGKKIVILCVVMIWFINAFFNMFYTYFCSILCFPILLCAIDKANKTASKKRLSI